MASLVVVERRVNFLEKVLSDYIIESRRVMRRMDMNSDNLHREMQEFKDKIDFYVEATRKSTVAFHKEMLEFKNEMLEFKNEMSEFKNEMLKFKNEMSEFKVEMSAFKDRMEKQSKQMNKQWGELANKMGTVVEDLVVPSIPRIATECFGFGELDIVDLMIRRHKRNMNDGNIWREFDAIAVSSHSVILNETKSTPNIKDIGDFSAFIQSNRFFEFFPEYQGRKMIPIFSSLYMRPDIVTELTRHGIFAMAMVDSGMDLVNFQECRSNAEG